MKLRYSFFLIVLAFISCSKNQRVSNQSLAMQATLSMNNVHHTLYTPEQVDQAPHPFYKDRAKDPIYPYPKACGYGSFLFDPETNKLHYAISYSGLSARPIMMHFHLGGSNAEGPIIQTIFGEPYKSFPGLGSSESPPLNGKTAPMGRGGFITGIYKLKGNSHLKPPLSVEDERKMLMEGNIYVNIHTYLNELGEIRGQINR